MIELRQATIADLSLGQFADKDDAVTPEAGLAGTMAVRLSKNGLAYAARDSVVAITHQEDGFYKVRLSAVDTGTLGRLRVKVVSAGVHLAVWQDFAVVSQAYWDVKYGSAALPANVTQIDGGGAAATALAANIANLDTAISNLNDLDAAAVKAEIVAGLSTDNQPELTEIPAAAASITEMITLLYMWVRNKQTASSLQATINNDAGTPIGTADISDSGSITTRGKFA